MLKCIICRSRHELTSRRPRTIKYQAAGPLCELSKTEDSGFQKVVHIRGPCRKSMVILHQMAKLQALVKTAHAVKEFFFSCLSIIETYTCAEREQVP